MHDLCRPYEIMKNMQNMQILQGFAYFCKNMQILQNFAKICKNFAAYNNFV